MDVIKAIGTEPVVAEFLTQPVPVQTVHKIIAAGQRAQSNFNPQPWRFIVVADLDRLRALSEGVRHSSLMADAAFAVVPVTDKMDLFEEGQLIAYMRLAAWDYGLASHLCPIVDPERFKLLLRLPDYLLFNTVMSFGIPYRKTFPSGAKKAGNLASPSLIEVMRWGHW